MIAIAKVTFSVRSCFFLTSSVGNETKYVLHIIPNPSKSLFYLATRSTISRNLQRLIAIDNHDTIATDLPMNPH